MKRERVGPVGEVGRARHVGRLALVSVVLVHLAISIVHGQAHTGAQVALSPAASAFVYIVILAGPFVGLAVARWRRDTGGWIVATAFAASLVFGFVNHFIISGADRVDHVAADWRPLFTLTATLLLASEAAGIIIGVRAALQGVRRTS
jgi:hypothetical protein